MAVVKQIVDQVEARGYKVWLGACSLRFNLPPHAQITDNLARVDQMRYLYKVTRSTTVSSKLRLKPH